VTWIETRTERTLRFEAPIEKVYAFLADVQRSGSLFPGIERIEDLGELRYRWVLLERNTAGLSFKGDYVVQYESNGEDELRWRTVSGNMSNSGTWKLVAEGRGVVGTVEVFVGVDIPVPRLLRPAVKLFTEREAARGVEQHNDAIKRAIEAK